MLRLAMALMLPLLLAACAGGTEPTALGAPTGTVSESPATEPTQTVSPPGIDPVEAAVREYVDAANVAMSTGDTSRFRAAVTPECTCLAFADRIDGVYSGGGKLERPRWTLLAFRPSDVSGESGTGVATMNEAAYRIVAADGVVQESVDASVFEQWVRLTAASGSWKVADVDEI